MKKILLNALLIAATLPILGTTTEQATVYPANPEIVQYAGQLNDPKLQEEFIRAMRKASRFVTVISGIVGILGIYCISRLSKQQTTFRKTSTIVGTVALISVALLLAQVAYVQKKMADQREMVNGQEIVIPQEPIAVDVADGIYILSGAHCPPCKQLHADMHNDARFTDLVIFDYDITRDAAIVAPLLAKLGVTLLTIPLTIVVKDGIIRGILIGYVGIDDFWNNISAMQITRQNTCTGTFCPA